MTEKETTNDFDDNESPWRPEEAPLDEPEPIELQPVLTEFENAKPNPDETVPPDSPQKNDEPSDEISPNTTPDDRPAPPAASESADNFPISTPAVIEAVLFATNEPITPQKIVEILGTSDVKEVRKHIDELNHKYEQMNCAFHIEGIAGGYQMLTLSPFNPWLGKLLHVRAETKLSPAALETLAIVAYKQPIMRVDVEAIRGVAAGEMIRQLIDKGLVKIVGRAEELGRPLLYGTTKKFLQVFGLNSLKDLPTAEDLKKPD
jgi:segregation and condensation protein B